MKDRALKERTTQRVIGVLIQRDDVGAVLGQHGSDRRDDACLVLTMHDQRRMIVQVRDGGSHAGLRVGEGHP